jgi:hypothetical protein
MMQTKKLLEKSMTKTIHAAAAALFGACLLNSMHIAAAYAQTNAGPAAADHDTTQSQQGPSAEEETSNRRAPVLQITSVEVIRSAHGPTLDIIRVRGLTSSGGWEESELVPLTRRASPDAVLDLVFTARTPEDAADATGFEAIEAIFPLEPGHPFKGVRVHAASQALTLKSVPGYVEHKPFTEDCSKCVGKHFVAKGGVAPTGKSEAEIVKEENLPPNVRVIKATDGVPSTDSDPNRITVVVGEDGRIVSAIWD